MLFFEIAKRADKVELPRPSESEMQRLRSSLSEDGASRLSQLVDLDDSALAVTLLLNRFSESMQRRMPNKQRLMEFY